jgi:hypothetical protein
MVVTFGLYVVVWTLRLAEDMRRTDQAKTRPALYGIGSLLPLVNLFVFHHQARQLRAALGGAALAPGAPRPVFLTMMVLGLGGTLTILGILDTMLPYLAVLLVYPLPWILLQGDVDRLRERRRVAEDTGWTWPPRRFRRGHYWVGVPGGLLVGMALLGAWGEIAWSRGEKIGSGQWIQGESRLFRLPIAQSGWRHVAAESLGDPDADLAISRIGSSTSVLAYTHSRATLDDTVRNRFRLMLDTDPDMSHHEQRRLQPSDGRRVSMAYYYGRQGILAYHWWVATAKVGNLAVEVIGGSDGEPGHRAEVEKMVRGLVFAEPVRAEP